MDVDHTVMIQYIQTLGFPVCASIAMGWALWKIGSRLLEAHFNFLNTIKEQGERQIKILEAWPANPRDICQASEVLEERNSKRKG